MPILIETSRLLLKEMSEDDVQDLFDLNNDPEVMRYTGDKSDDGFKRLQLDCIFATAMKENTPSINIFKKLGLKYLKDQDCGCQPGVIYAITKQEWK